MHDIIVIGAGPAGLTAALYALRGGKSVLVLEKGTFGGQVTYSPKIENYPGFVQMSGAEFADKLVEQVLNQGADIEMETVTGLSKADGAFTVSTDCGEHKAKAVIIAVGVHHRRLGLEGEEELIGNGIGFCAVCDGAFYADGTVAVIGGGNSALQEALLLAETCRKVYVVQNLDFLTGEGKLADAVNAKDNIEVIYGATVDSLIAEDALKGIVLNVKGEKQELMLDGMFIAIGLVPKNEIFEGITALKDGYIAADESCVTDMAGVFVAGDCRTKSVRQITTATADGATAALAACRYLDGR
ncbi:MAG: FAD-dependent oxidoreductase [Ruminococcaceae bacterium]|nr:FAD-dependent oxidoreductase [Oscillospiraceae bacterium]